MAEVKELLIRISYESDEEGVKKATAQVEGLGNAMNKAGKQVEDSSRKSVNGMRSMGREFQTTARVASMSGMMIMNMGMALGSTGTISQETAKNLTTLGAGLAASGHAASLAGKAMSYFGITIAGAMPYIAVITIALTALYFWWNKNQEAMRVSRGEFKDLNDVIINSKGLKDFTTNTLPAYIYDMKLASYRTEDLRRAIRDANPEFDRFLDLQESLARLQSDTSLYTTYVEKQRRVVDALRDVDTLTKKVIQDEKDLKRAREDLNDMSGDEAKLERDLASARRAYAMGYLSIEGLESAEKALSTFQRQRDTLEDAITTGEETLSTDREDLAIAQEKLKALGAQGMTMKEAEGLLTIMEGKLLSMEEKQGSITSEMARIKDEIGPEIISVYEQIGSAIDKNALTKTNEWYNATVAVAEVLGAIGEPSEGERVGTGLPAVLEAGGLVPDMVLAEGTPYVPKTGLALIHKGEAVIPANQNTYADSMHIRNVNLNQGYTFDAFMKDRDRAIRIKRKMLGYT